MSKDRDYTTPIAIVIAGAIIAGALYFANTSKNTATQNNKANEQVNLEKVKLRPISEKDLYLGDPKNAKVVVYEYSDTECPFCKRFHATMNKIVKDYDGKVAWVYRHFPLDMLHSKARPEAEAVACVVKIAGREKGFDFLNKIFEETPSNNGLNLEDLPKFAAELGVDKAAFIKCSKDRETKSLIEADSKEAMSVGAEGTPYNVIVYGDKKLVVPGGVPYEQMKQVLDQILSE